MEVTRTFHSIGQGGFYTESFDDLPDKPMVVFDCGGKSSKLMKDYINSFLPTRSKATIEAVFISHLHDDHINGLQHLIDRANVKKMFLPQFNPNQLFEIIFYNTARGAKDKFHHPNIDTLINIFHQGCKPFVVTEDKSTIIMQYFRI